jgi:hypothetical protein
MLSKIDLSNGSWRMLVQKTSIWNFAYVMPDLPGHPIRIVIPPALQMGWVESPSYFYAATETGCDVIQGLLSNEVQLPPHCLNTTCTQPNPPSAASLIVLLTGSTSTLTALLAWRSKTKAALFLAASPERLSTASIPFPPPHLSQATQVARIPYLSKNSSVGMLNGTRPKKYWGSCQQQNQNGSHLRFQSQRHRLRNSLHPEKATCANKTLPPNRGQTAPRGPYHARYKRLVLPINKALQGKPQVIGLSRTSDVRAAFLDLAHMVANLAHHPTHVKELVPGDDHYTGYCDACAAGAGGVWISGNLDLRPLVWRVPFLAAITNQVISNTNPRGTLTNSDLEMAAVLLHYMVLQQKGDLRFVRAGVWSDNMPTVAWTKRMADRLQAPTAGQLLRGLAALKRSVQAGPFTISSIAGKANDMANIASRSFGITCNTTFLPHFNHRFPSPQQQFWRLVPLMPEWISLVILTLDGKRLPLQQWMTAS